MTEKQKKAQNKIQATEKKLGDAMEELSKNRTPLSKDEKLPPVCSMQVDKNNLKELEVLNSKEAVVVNLDTPIPAKDYDKRQEAGKRTHQQTSEETVRE